MKNDNAAKSKGARESEIEEIEEEIRKTPYHKATQAHIGRLKAKLAKLKSAGEKAGGGGKKIGFGVKKSGDATVILVGFPSVGKSTLINRITNAESKTGHYDFTTLDVIPGMMEYRGARIQVLDVPGLISEAAKGAGRGKQVLSAVRNADLIVMVLDRMKQLGVIRKELYDAGFRLDEKRPDVRIMKKERDGIRINLAFKKPALSKETIKSVLGEFKIHNAEVVVRENIDLEQFIDAVAGNRIYVPSLVVLNKMDKMDARGPGKKSGAVMISALKGRNLDALKKAIWEKLNLLRIYMKPVGKEADMEEPLVLRKGCTVTDVSGKILKGGDKDLKYARIWGPSARFPGQKVGNDHKLKDGDVVELRT